MFLSGAAVTDTVWFLGSTLPGSAEVPLPVLHRDAVVRAGAVRPLPAGPLPPGTGTGRALRASDVAPQAGPAARPPHALRAARTQGGGKSQHSASLPILSHSERRKCTITHPVWYRLCKVRINGRKVT